MITSTSGRSRGNTPAKLRLALAKPPIVVAHPENPEFKKTVLEIETESGTFISDCKEATLRSIIRYGKPVIIQEKQMTDREYFSNPATNASASFFS